MGAIWQLSTAEARSDWRDARPVVLKVPLATIFSLRWARLLSRTTARPVKRCILILTFPVQFVSTIVEVTAIRTQCVDNCIRIRTKNSLCCWKWDRKKKHPCYKERTGDTEGEDWQREQKLVVNWTHSLQHQNKESTNLYKVFEEGFYSALSWLKMFEFLTDEFLSICIDLILSLWSETHSSVKNSNNSTNLFCRQPALKKKKERN